MQRLKRSGCPAFLAVTLLWAGLGLVSGCAMPQGPQGDEAVGRAHYNRAMAFGQAHQLDKAARELELAVQSDPGLYYGYHQLGLVYEAMGRKAEAVRVWQQGLSVAKSGPERAEYPRAQAVAEMQSAVARVTAPPPPPAMAPPPIPVQSPALAAGPKPAPKVKTSSLGASRASASAKPAKHGYAVLFSSNAKKASAESDVKKLKAKGYAATLSTHQAKGKTWHRVVVGCCGDEKKARALAAELKKKGLAKSPEVIRL
ncbi:MAG: SPOR domain-containing protein [Thermodesulfobacteriota bacterium]